MTQAQLAWLVRSDNVVENGGLVDFGLSLDVGIIVAIIALALELRRQQRSDRELAQRDRARSQFEIYQRLELASIDLHRFEADHLDLIRPLYTGSGAPKDPAAMHAYTNYVSQILILFELQIELYCNELVDRKILQTWRPWFNELGLAPGFPALWSDGVAENYSERLQNVMNRIVESQRGLEPHELLDAIHAGASGATDTPTPVAGRS